MSSITDISLAHSGEKKIQWVAAHMPILNAIAEDFKKTKPFAGLKCTLSVHLEAKTAYLCRVLAMGGADMRVTGSNPLSTQDDVAAALVAGGIEVFAHHGVTMEQYEADIRAALECGQDGDKLRALTFETIEDTQNAPPVYCVAEDQPSI